MNEITKELLEALKDAEEALSHVENNLHVRVNPPTLGRMRKAIAKAEAALAAPQPADDGWIPWNGGDCPVEVGTRVDAKYRDGEKAYNVPAGECAEDPDRRSALDWSHMESNYDIIAYRIAKEPGK